MLMCSFFNFSENCFQFFLTNGQLNTFLDNDLQKFQHLNRQIPVIHCAIIQNVFRDDAVSPNANHHTLLCLLYFFINTAIRKYKPALYRSVKYIYVCVRDTVFIVCNLYAENRASHGHGGIWRIHLINRIRTKLAVQPAD